MMPTIAGVRPRAAWDGLQLQHQLEEQGQDVGRSAAAAKEAELLDETSREDPVLQEEALSSRRLRRLRLADPEAGQEEDAGGHN